MGDGFILILGVIGSVASLISLLIAAPGVRSKIIHVIYALVLTALAAGIVEYKNKFSAAQARIEEIHRVQNEANAILSTADRSTNGSMAGFILSSLSFLEKHKAVLPETYTRAVKLSENSGYLQPHYTDASSDYQRFHTLQEASGAMEYLLRGLAAEPHN